MGGPAVPLTSELCLTHAPCHAPLAKHPNWQAEAFGSAFLILQGTKHLATMQSAG